VFLAAWWQRDRWGKPVLFGLGYAVLMFLPVLGFLNIYFFRFSYVANHWQYFSIIGPVALVAAVLTMAVEFLERRGVFLKPLLAATLLVALGVLTWQQAAIYKNAEILWRTTSTENPGSFLAHDNLGFILLQRGEVAAALDQIQTAVRLQPDDETAQKNLGSALLEVDRFDDAIIHFQNALEMKPADSGAENNLGFALLRKGRTQDAITHYRKALEEQPDDTGARHNLGSALMSLGQVDDAIDQFQQSLAIQPDSPEAHNDIANAFAKLGREADAIQNWEKALAANPDYMPALNNLAWALATNPGASIRNGPKALQLARQADELSGGNNPIVLRTLAAACAEDGRFSTALIVVGRAIELAATRHNVPLMDSLEAQSNLYEAGQPCHIAPEPGL
jgi:Flp pilus assembly protein TadD